MKAERLGTPDQWAAALPHPLAASSDESGWRSGLIRRWAGGSGEIVQPPIDHHYVVLHLGGPKRVTRIGGGRTVSASVQEGELTLVPAGTRYDWMTVGPIDFVHLYVHPSRLGALVASAYDQDAASVTLDEGIGISDPLLAQLMREMLDGMAAPDPGSHSYLDALMEAALAQLARKHSTLGVPVQPLRSAMSRRRLRRVCDYVEAHLSQGLRLDDLAAVAGLSRYHFSRSFQAAMGEPPMTYLARRRLEKAKALLRTSDLPVFEVGARSGLGAPSQFAALFRRATGSTPSGYRRQH